MPVIGGYIGAMQFMRLEGTIQPPFPASVPIKEPWEDGLAVSLQGREGAQSVLVGTIDLVSPLVITVLNLYSQLVATSQLVQILRNGSFVVYPNVYIWAVEDVTPDDMRFAFNAVGGVNAGQHLLMTRWTVQYALAF